MNILTSTFKPSFAYHNTVKVWVADMAVINATRWYLIIYTNHQQTWVKGTTISFDEPDTIKSV